MVAPVPQASHGILAPGLLPTATLHGWLPISFQSTEILASYANRVAAKPAAAGPNSPFVRVQAPLSGGGAIPGPSAPLGHSVTHFAAHSLILTCSGSTNNISHGTVRYVSEEEI